MGEQNQASRRLVWPLVVILTTAFGITPASVSVARADTADRGYWMVKGWVYRYTYDPEAKLHTYAPVQAWEYSRLPGQQMRLKPLVTGQPIPGTWGPICTSEVRISPSGSRVTVVVAPAQGQLGTAYSAMARRAVARIGGSLELPRTECAVTVHVYSNLAQFESTLPDKWPIKKGILGYTASPRMENRPYIVCIDGTLSLSKTEEVLAHEMTHVVLIACLGKHDYSMPEWYNEGVARYLEKNTQTNPRDAARLALMTGDKIPNIAILNQQQDQCPSVNTYRMAVYSVDLVAFCSRKYGRDWIAEVLRLLRNGSSFEAAFKTATGISIKDASEEWHQDLARRIRQEKIRGIAQRSTIPAVLLVITLLAIMVLARRRQRSG